MSYIDETGNRYGKLVVIKRDPVRTERGKLAYWICKCDCGKVKSIYGANLRRGLSKSCGCRRMKDECGKRFGKLVAIERDENRREFYLCQCDCGKKTYVRGGSLRDGTTKSCGCITRLIDETGKRYGKLVVVRRAENTIKVVDGTIVSGSANWICQCDCGNQKLVSGGSLRSGSTKSCGCAHTLPDGESSFNLVYGQAKKGARVRGLSWNLSKEEFRNITSKECYYCGETPNQRVPESRQLNGNYVYNGIDRVDNEVGYVLENCVPCCKKCNVAKHAMSVGEFRNLIVSVYNHWASK